MTTLSCPESQQNFPDMYSGKLDLVNKQKMWNHLDNCTVCKSKYHDFKLIHKVIAELPVEPVPRLLRPRILHQLDVDKHLGIVTEHSNLEQPIGKPQLISKLWRWILLIFGVKKVER